jgi:DNA-binding transcriptional regulator PaaX
MVRQDARTTVFGVLMLSGRPSLTLAQFVELAAAAGVPEGTVKAQVSRMVLDGSLERTPAAGRSTYAVSRKRERLVRALRLRMTDPDEPWDGRWLVAAVRLPADRGRRSRLIRRLRFHGFRAWGRGVFLRPAWPRDWAQARLAESVEPGAAVAVVGEADPAPPETLWDLGALDRRFVTAATRIRRLTGTRDPRRAFASRLAIGAILVRALSEDPLLPPALWGARRGRTALLARHAAADSRLARASTPFVLAVVGNDANRRPA